MDNKKSLLALALVSLVGIIGGTFAYFTSTATLTNEFTTGIYSTSVSEKFVSPDNWTPGTTTVNCENLDTEYAGAIYSLDITIETIQADKKWTYTLVLVSYKLGDEITVAGETFNVIKDNGDTITMLAQLKELGCTVPTDYAWVLDSNARICANSANAEWLVNGQKWWTRSIISGYSQIIWCGNALGGLFNLNYDNGICGVHPVITISKSAL